MNIHHYPKVNHDGYKMESSEGYWNMVIKIHSMVFTLLLIIMQISSIIASEDTVYAGNTIDWILIKGIEPADGIGSAKNTGHYWIEILDENGKPIESYGWFPQDRFLQGDVINAIVGVPGELNAQTRADPEKRGEPTHDPDEGDPADWEYHPVLTSTMTKQEILNKIRDYANTYDEKGLGLWATWRSCHEFQKDLMNNVGLAKPPETSPVTANVAQLGMIGKQQQSKPTAPAMQKTSGFVINSASAKDVFSGISKWKDVETANNAKRIEEGLQQAVALCIQGRYEDAIRAYAVACGNDPWDVYPYMYNEIGDALNKIGRTTEANICYTKAEKGQQILDSYTPPPLSGSYTSPSPSSSGSSGSSGGLSSGQKQAIEQAIDNMVPGEYNQYYNTEPRFELAGNPRLD